jgi:hypothetical protein
MSFVDITPKHIWLRHSLGFPSSGSEQGPYVIWVELELSNPQDRFRLRPIRLQSSSSVGEWFLADDRPVIAQVHWRIPQSNTFSSHNLTLLGPLRLTLGEVAQTPNEQQDNAKIDQFVLTGGGFGVNVVHTDDLLNGLLKMLWPTRSFADVMRIRCEPGGLHVEGRLPAGFFPPTTNTSPLSDANRVVVLRLPRDKDDQMDAGNVVRPMWTLGSHRFTNSANPSLTYPTSITHVNGWAAALRQFRLEADASRSMDTFVDSVHAEPAESCIVRVLGAEGPQPSRRIDWFAVETGMRINLGGGAAAEATYLPDQIRGRAPMNSTQDWSASFDAPPGMKPTDPPEAMPQTLSITLTRPSQMVSSVSATLQPVAAPIVPIRSQNGSQIIDQSDGYRLWMCTDSGWAAFDSAGALARIDPKQDTQGAISGVLEVGPILSQLRPLGESTGLPDGLQVQARTRLTGEVKLTLAGRAAQTVSLTLVASDLFLTVVTPAVFFQPPQPDAHSDFSTATSSLPTLTTVELAPNQSHALGLENPYVLASTLEQKLSELRMRSVVFVSTNVIQKTNPLTRRSLPSPLTVTLPDKRWDLPLVFPAGATVVWHRPSQFPLVRTYPLNADQTLTGFLDVNRGLLPFRTTRDVEFHFFQTGLPTLDVPEIDDTFLRGELFNVTDTTTGRVLIRPGWRLTNASGSGGSAKYFGPAIPGLELDLAPAFLDSDKAPEWILRHSVPPLDEAYATVAEVRRDPTSTTSSEPGQPQPGDLPYNFDPTRVVGTEAFRFGLDTQTIKALGWLPMTSDSRDGSLNLSLQTASLKGRRPKLAIRLSNLDNSKSINAEFSRTSSVAGLEDVPLRIGRPAADNLESFAAKLKPDSEPSESEYNDAIRNNGLPLLAATVNHRIVTHDVVGLRHEEPLGGLSRFRTLIDLEPRLRKAESFELPAGELSSMHLDIAAVELTSKPSSASEIPRQTWQLHDGQGRFPKLGGFAFRPTRLETYCIDHKGNRTVSIEGTIELKQPRQLVASAIDDPMCYLISPNAATVKLTWEQPAESGWRLTQVIGDLDWRFNVRDSDEIQVMRLSASLTGLPIAGVWPLVLTQLELTTANGPLELGWKNSTIKATLSGGKLIVEDTSIHEQKTFSVAINGFTLEREKFDPDELTPATSTDGAVPDWSDTGVSLEYKLIWQLEASPLKWSLVLARGLDELADGWWLTVDQEMSTFINTKLMVTPSGQRRIVFHSTKAGNHSPRMPDGSWFTRRNTDGDRIAGGAIFRKADELESLSAHVVVQLASKVEVHDVKGQIAARLSVDTKTKLAADLTTGEMLKIEVVQELSVTGWLELKNQINLQGESQNDLKRVNHSATLVFRKARWPVSAIFFGTAPSGLGNQFVAPVEHSVIFNDRKASWQAVQPVRLLRREEFASLYLAGPVTENKDGLVIDLSWAFWLRVPQEKESVTIGGGVELSSPFLTDTWKLRQRPISRGEFDHSRAFVCRLPFGCGGPCPVPNQVVQLSQHQTGNRELMTSGAATGSSIAALPIAVRKFAFTNRAESISQSLEFEAGGPNSQWLDAEKLSELFADADQTTITSARVVSPLLPAYTSAAGSPTNKLPSHSVGNQRASIPDWAWLLESLTSGNDVLEIAAAALRTPYIPRSTSIPLVGSALIELPFRFAKADGARVPFNAAGSIRFDVQLLTFVGRSVRMIRKASLELDLSSTDGTADDLIHSRDEIALDWAREVLAESRREQAAIILLNFESGFVATSDEAGTPEPSMIIRNLGILSLPRAFTAIRTDRPTWPAAPLSPQFPKSHGENQLPSRDPDPRCRPPRPLDSFSDGKPLTQTALTCPVALKLGPEQLEKVPEFFVFASRPEIPPQELSTREISATRHRLILTSDRGQSDPILSPARRSNVCLLKNSSDDPKLSNGELIGLTKTEDVTFQVVQSGAFPSSGIAPHARREAVPRVWADDVDEPKLVTTIAPPLIDIVTWGRRPGELTRSLIAGHRSGYPDLTNAAVGLQAYEDSPAIGQDITTRRTRAKAGPFERVSIEPIHTQRLLGGLFQYTRIRLNQTLDATAPPQQSAVYAVIGTKSEIGLSAETIADAEAAPTIIRANRLNGHYEQYSIFLVADKDFTPYANFVASGKPMRRTVLLIRRGESTLPPAGDKSDLPPVLECPEAEMNKWEVLLDEEVTNPSHTNVNQKQPWMRLAQTELLERVFYLDVLQILKNERSDRVTNLIKDATRSSTPLYVLLATYTRVADSDDKPWTAPASPLLAIQIQFLDPRGDFEKPKSSVTLLQATKITPPDGHVLKISPDENYCFSGYGRLGDDDFQPIRPVPFQTSSSPNEEADSKPLTTARVGWARTVDINSLDRLPRKQPHIEPRGQNARAACPFEFDLVFYGPGGELIPTESTT